MRHRELAHLGTPHLQRHHWFALRGSSDRLEQRATIIHALQMEADHLRSVVVGQEVEDVCESDVGGIAEADPDPQAQALTIREEAHREVHASAARDDRRRPRVESGHVRHEVGHHAVGHVHEAGGVRTEHSDAVLAGDSQRRVLQDPTLPGLGEATRADDRSPHAAGTAVVERGRHGLGRHDEHREVDRPADRPRPRARPRDPRSRPPEG